MAGEARDPPSCPITALLVSGVITTTCVLIGWSANEDLLT